MNERIRALAEEAVDAVQSRPNGICDMNKYNQKFAELIGRECLSIADNIRDECDQDDEPQQALGAAWVAIAIARHFGLDK